MYQNIKQDYICYVLRHYQQKVSDIQKQILSLSQILNRTDKEETILSASLPRLQKLEVVQKQRTHELSDVIFRYHDIMERRDKQLLQIIDQSIEELETVHRIMTCYYLLEDQERSILEQLYCKEKDVKITAVAYSICENRGISLTTLKRWRKKALSHLTELYESASSTQALLHKSQVPEKGSN